MKFYFLLCTIFAATLSVKSQAETELTDGIIFHKNKKYQVSFIEDGNKQYIVSKEFNSKKEIKKVEIWHGGDGRLNKIQEQLKSGNVSVFEFGGTDGDYSFFEIIAINEENGDIAHLIGGDSFNVALNLIKNAQLTVNLKQNEEADSGSFHLVQKNEDKVCSKKVTEVANLESEKQAIIKRAGPIPKGPNSKKIEQLTERQSKISPHEFEFELADLLKIKVTCK
jgi:hypothetical protein